MKTILILIFLGLLCVPATAQFEVQMGYGLGGILGSWYDGKAVAGDMSYHFRKRLSARVGVASFIVSERPYYRTSNYGSTIIESTLDNALDGLIGPDEKELFEEGLIQLRSKLDKITYLSTDLSLGYDILKKNRWNIRANLGATFAKFDQTYNVYRVGIQINSPFENTQAILFVPIYRSYLDLGWSSSLQCNYKIYKQLQIGLEFKANNYRWSKDGFWYGALKFGIAI